MVGLAPTFMFSETGVNVNIGEFGGRAINRWSTQRSVRSSR